MADIRINALATTATTPASDDYLALDGAAQGTRKILATNIANNVTDVILGTSGPSVKSTLSARAPRQGLVFNGTSGVSCSVPAPGTNNYTYAVWVYWADSSIVRYLFGAAGGPTVGWYIRTDGKMGISDLATGDIVSSNAITLNKWSLVSIRRSSGTLYFGINGVEEAGVTDSRNYTQASAFIGASTSLTTNPFNGVLVPYVENRALSASEVVALYEAGAPAGADYNNATNTAFTNGTFANVGYSTFSGASATGFVATYSGGGEAAATSQIANLSVAPGRKYLIKFDLTLTSGTAPYVGLAQFGVQWLTGSAAVTTGQVRAAAGANSIVVTIRSVNATFATNAGVGFASQEASSFTVSNLTATPLGLLLAPDAAQAGGGLVWYDTSGNAANITLPASGVSWNVPSSLKLGGNWTVAGTFTNTSTAQLAHTYTGAPANFNFGTFDTSGNASLNVQSNANLLFATFNTERARITASGNYLIGTTTDSGNGKLQLATHTTSAGGIGFGTDTSLYRAGAGALYANSSGSTNLFGLTISGTRKSLWYFDGTDTLFGADTGSLKLVSNGTTALTLDSSQNATFAKGVTLTAGSITLTDTYTLGWGNGTAYVQGSVAGNYVRFGTAGSLALTLDGSQNATFAGKLYSVSGTATTPAFSFTGDTGTGMYRSSAGIGALAASGSTAAFWASNVFAIYSGVPLRLGNAYTAGAPTATGYVTIQDSAGNTYKVLVGT